MHFCITGQYTPKALNSILENPKTSRYEAAKKLIEAAGGTLVSMYSTAAEGPGVLVSSMYPTPFRAGHFRHRRSVRRHPQSSPHSFVDAG